LYSENGGVVELRRKCSSL